MKGWMDDDKRIKTNKRKSKNAADMDMYSRYCMSIDGHPSAWHINCDAATVLLSRSISPQKRPLLLVLVCDSCDFVLLARNRAEE